MRLLTSDVTDTTRLRGMGAMVITNSRTVVCAYNYYLAEVQVVSYEGLP